jgi:hypothetical protein
MVMIFADLPERLRRYGSRTVPDDAYFRYALPAIPFRVPEMAVARPTSAG